MAEEARTNNQTLDGKPVTDAQLNEARNNEATRIIEDKDNKGEFRTLNRLHG